MLETVTRTFGEALNEPEVILPVGYLDGQGNRHRTFEMIEMTGHVDEAMNDPKVRTNPGKQITAALTALLSSVGSLKKPKTELVRSLFNADRDFLMLYNYHNSIAIDDNLCWDETCPYCSKQFEVQMDYKQIPITYLAESEKLPVLVPITLPGGIKKGDQVYKDLKISLPTGEAQEKLAALARENQGQAVTSLLALVTEEIKGLENWSFDTFKDMLVKDRNFVGKTINDIDIGPNMTTDVQCANCARTYKTAVPARKLLGE